MGVERTAHSSQRPGTHRIHQAVMTKIPIPLRHRLRAKEGKRLCNLQFTTERLSFRREFARSWDGMPHIETVRLLAVVCTLAPSASIKRVVTMRNIRQRPQLRGHDGLCTYHISLQPFVICSQRHPCAAAPCTLKCFAGVLRSLLRSFLRHRSPQPCALPVPLSHT